MKSLITLSFLALAVVGCSDKSDGPKKISECGSGWKMLSLDNKSAKQKTDITEDKPLEIAAGTYDATSTTFYYRNKAADIKMQVQIRFDAKTGVATSNVQCISGSGVNNNMKTISISVPFVSNMVVAENGKTILTNRTFNLEIGPKSGERLIRATSAVKNDGVEGSLKDTYKGSPDVREAFYRYSSSSYETRALVKEKGLDKSSLGGDGQIGLSVSFAKDRVIEEDPATEPAVKTGEAKPKAPSKATPSTDEQLEDDTSATGDTRILQ